MKSRIANAVFVDGAGVYKEGVGGCTYHVGIFFFFNSLSHCLILHPSIFCSFYVLVVSACLFVRVCARTCV